MSTKATCAHEAAIPHEIAYVQNSSGDVFDFIERFPKDRKDTDDRYRVIIANLFATAAIQIEAGIGGGDLGEDPLEELIREVTPKLKGVASGGDARDVRAQRRRVAREMLTAAARGGVRVLKVHSVDHRGCCTCDFSKEKQFYCEHGEEMSIDHPSRCNMRGKHPVGTDWNRLAFSNLDAVERVLLERAAGPYMNWGVAIGPQDNIAILDFDGPDGLATFDAWSQDGTLPPTVTTITGSGGRHAFLRVPPGWTIKNTAKQIFGRNGENLGVDVRGEGGFVVAPGSRHRSGGTYEWVNGRSFAEIGIADAPIALLRAMFFATRDHIESPDGTKAPASTFAGGARAPGSAATDVAGASASASPGKRPDSSFGSKAAQSDTWRDKLAVIGDNAGCGGYDAPINAVANAYFGANGIDADPVPLKQAIRERIDTLGPRAADKAPAARYSSDEYLDDRLRKSINYVAERKQKPSHGASDADLTKRVLAFNQDHAFVAVGGGRYTVRGVDGELEFKSKTAFEQLYAHEKHYYKGKKKTIAMPFVKAWIEHEQARKYVGTCFRPGARVDNASETHLNLYEGLGVTPKRGSWKLLDQHLREVICNNNETAYNYVKAWQAYHLQNLGNVRKKLPTSITLRGEKGCGKSIYWEVFGSIFGKYCITVSKPEQFLGKFNALLATSCFTIMEEAFYSGDKRSVGVIKDLLTGKSQIIEPKGIDPFTAPNFMQFVIISNEKRPVPIDASERRFYVLEASSARIGDKAYFAALEAEIEAGGAAAMAYDLLNYTPPHGWDFLRDPPRTEAGALMIAQGLEPIERFILDMAHRGYFGRYSGEDLTGAEREFRLPADEGGTVWVSSSVLRDAFARFMKHEATQHERAWVPPSNHDVGVGLRRVLGSMGDAVESAKSAGVRGWKFADQDALLKAMIKHPHQGYGAYLAEKQDSMPVDEGLDDKMDPITLAGELMT